MKCIVSMRSFDNRIILNCSEQSGYTKGKLQGVPALGPPTVVQGKVRPPDTVLWLTNRSSSPLEKVRCRNHGLASEAAISPDFSFLRTPWFWSYM